MAEQHTILGGKVYVYKRPNSTFWQCSNHFAGKNRRVSTKEESLAKAKEIAEDWYLQLRGKLRTGTACLHPQPDFCSHEYAGGIPGKVALPGAIAGNRFCAPTRRSAGRSAGNRARSRSGSVPGRGRVPGRRC